METTVTFYITLTCDTERISFSLFTVMGLQNNGGNNFDERGEGSVNW